MAREDLDLTRARTAAVAVSGALLLLAGLSPVAVARPATVTGKVPATSQKLDGRPAGTASAVSATTGEYLARGFLRRGDAYTLRVPPARVVGTRSRSMRSDRREREHRRAGSDGVLFAQICVPDLPTTISGTFSGTAVLPWGARPSPRPVQARTPTAR
jgi:hypothetical protein